MGKSKKNRAAATKQIQHKNQTSAEAFSFGDPVPVLDRRELLDYVECVQMDRWYEPPVSFDGLARTFRAAVHHSSPIAVKCNILTSTYIPHPLLSQQAFSRFVQDYRTCSNTPDLCGCTHDVMWQFLFCHLINWYTWQTMNLCQKTIYQR